MGIRCSREDADVFVPIVNRKKSDVQPQPKDVKVILLGTGDSGKSTLFKQLKLVYEKGYSEEDLQQYKSAIYYNIIETISTLAKECLKKEEKFDSLENEIVAKRIIGKAESANGRNAQVIYTDDFAHDVETLWQDYAIKNRFKHRYDYHVFDGATYFFDDLKRLREPYIPSIEDVLHCRRKSTGIIEGGFTKDGYRFRFIDVGGQRPERKKWINLFDGTNALLYVVSLSDYDQKCYEDDTTNRMIESMDLFDEICNGHWFCELPIVLLFNKVDIFKEKIKTTSLSDTFPEYYGRTDEEAISFITKKFLSVNKHEPNRISCRYTNATNTEQARQTLESVRNTLMRSMTSNS